jgi:hypothetical protein
VSSVVLRKYSRSRGPGANTEKQFEYLHPGKSLSLTSECTGRWQTRTLRNAPGFAFSLSRNTISSFPSPSPPPPPPSLTAFMPARDRVFCEEDVGEDVAAVAKSSFKVRGSLPPSLLHSHSQNSHPFEPMQEKVTKATK